VWNSDLSISEWLEYEFEKICDEIEAEESIEDFGPQIELNLENPEDLGESPIEIAGVAPTEVVEVEEEDSSVEFLVSGKTMKGDQAEGIGDEPLPEDAELDWKGQAMGRGEPVHEHDRSGEEPDLMKVDQAVRTGKAPVREGLEERTGVEPVPKEAVEETGAMPVRETGEGDLHFDDYLGDDSEKVGEFSPEETSQTPPASVPEQPVKTPPVLNRGRR